MLITSLFVLGLFSSPASATNTLLFLKYKSVINKLNWKDFNVLFSLTDKQFAVINKLNSEELASLTNLSPSQRNELSKLTDDRLDEIRNPLDDQ